MYLCKEIYYKESAHIVIEVYCIYIYKEIYCKEFAHTVIEGYKSKIRRLNQQAGYPGELIFKGFLLRR